MPLTTPGGRALGVRFAPPDPRSFPYPHARALLVGAPQDIDLRPRMQPVGDQGQLGSCTGWAGTAALEAKLGDGQRSALYVYYYDRKEDGTPASSDAGATMLGLCKALKDYGAPPEAEWQYGNGAYFDIEPVQSAQDRATRIDAYYQIQGTGMPLLQGLWAALEAGEPVPIALYVYPSFERTGRDGKVPMVLSGEQVLGGHAITACGWFNDNSAPGGYGWVMAQNSWSTSFGDQGYVYLPAAYFTAGIVMEGWVLSVRAPVPPAPEPEPDVNLDETRGRLEAIQNECDRDDLRHTQITPPSASLTKAQLYQLCFDNIAFAADIQSGLGRIWEHAQTALDALPKVDPPAPEPGPQFVSPLPNGAVYGKTKWLAGSRGADFFVPRGRIVVAPADCIVEEIIGGTGLQGGAEIILALPDKSWAWRYRHVQALSGIRVGSRVARGQEVAMVMDTSLDQLGNPPAWSQPMPDKYQHLDLSVNRGTDQFSPQGGGGGNVDADAWMESLGYQGRVLSRTPGPTDAGRTLAEAITLMGRPRG